MVISVYILNVHVNEALPKTDFFHRCLRSKMGAKTSMVAFWRMRVIMAAVEKDIVPSYLRSLNTEIITSTVNRISTRSAAQMTFGTGVLEGFILILYGKPPLALISSSHLIRVL